MIVDGILEKSGIKIGPTEKKVILVGEIALGIWGVRKLHSMQEEKKRKKQQEELMRKYQEMQMMQAMQGGAAAPGGGTMPGAPTINGGGLSFAPVAYANMAAALDAAMNTSGTDEAAVRDTMKKLKTLDDYNALEAAFGLKTNYVFGLPVYTEGLAYWVNDEMGGSAELQEINNYFAQKMIPVIL